MAIQPKHGIEFVNGRLNWLRLSYRLTGNPICVIQAFQCARDANRPVPEWVMDHLDDAFRSYCSDEGNASLDKSFGLAVGRGQTPKDKSMKNHMRDLQIMLAVYILRVNEGLSIADAAIKVAVKLPESKYLQDNTIASRYEREHWEKLFDETIFEVQRSRKKRPS